MTRVPVRALALAALLAAAPACGGGEETAPARPAAPAPEAPAAEEPESPATAPAPAADPTAAPGAGARAEAERIFATRCATCHGPQGQGDGPGAAALTPRPRDHTDPKWQASVTDAHLRKVILEGGAAVGMSPAMPPNPDLASKPEVVDALVAHVRSLGG